MILAGFGLGTVLILRFYKKTMGGITGDMLGAMTEVMEAGFFWPPAPSWCRRPDRKTK